MKEIITLPVGQMAANCYIVGDIIIDPGDDAEYIVDHIPTTPRAIILTHGHFDHCMAAFALQSLYTIPVYLHPRDVFLVKRMKESAHFFLGIETDPPPIVTPLFDVTVDGFRILHTPGHTPGSISLVREGAIFTGDTIFADGGIGRADHEYSSKPDIYASVKTILAYPPETMLYPGHGGCTHVGDQRPYHVQ